jgi:hypothetical protein
MDPLLDIKILHAIIYIMYKYYISNDTNVPFYILHSPINKVILEGSIKFDDSIQNKKWNNLYSVIVSNTKLSDTTIDALLRVNYVWNPDTMDLFIFGINIKNFFEIDLVNINALDDMDNIDVLDDMYIRDTLEELLDEVKREKAYKLIALRDQYMDYRYVTFKQALEWLSPDLLLLNKDEIVKMELRLREMIIKESILYENNNELILDLYNRDSVDSKFMTRILLEFGDKMTPEEALKFVSK